MARSRPGTERGGGAPTPALAALAGLAWGLAEATFFFVVPDVLLSAIALRSGRAALAATVAAVGGAGLGGAAMYLFARADPALARAAVDGVPFIPTRLFDDAAALSAQHGGLGILVGAFQGLPYKIFAVQAPEAQSLAALVGWTVPGRAARFLLVVALAAVVARTLGRRWPRGLVVAWAVAWLAVYGTYWSQMSR